MTSAGLNSNRVDRIKIAVETPENLREGLAEVARSATGKRLRERLRVCRRASHEKLYASAVNDRVVGAAHRRHKIGMRRAERRRAHAVDDPFKRELQFVGLVQGDLQHPRDNLRAARQALRRCVNHGQGRGSDAAFARHRSHDFGGRGTFAFDNSVATSAWSR